MTHTSNLSHSERRGRRLKRIGHGGVIRSRTALETMTDASLWATIFGATACFGGRAAIGQFILVIGASLTAALWLLNHLISQDSEYTWTGSEPLWLIGIVIGLLQIVHCRHRGSITFRHNSANSCSHQVNIIERALVRSYGINCRWLPGKRLQAWPLLLLMHSSSLCSFNALGRNLMSNE